VSNLVEPFISVLTPSWNRVEFLEVLISSLKNQTFKNFEWVIGNDGSIDGTNELLSKEIENLGFPVTYISSDLRIGKAKMDNLLLDHAKGEYLIWCDSDDCFAENALEGISEILAKNHINSHSGIVGVIGQNLDTNGVSQTFNSTTASPIDGIYSWKELEEILLGDGTICVKKSIFDNQRWPEVDFLITESVLLRDLYKDNNFYLTSNVLKIMDRNAENSVSFGSKMQYCRGSAYCLSAIDIEERFYRLNLSARIIKVIHFFRYCIHGDIKLSQAKSMWTVLQKNSLYLIFFPLSAVIATIDIFQNRVIKTHLEFERNKELAFITIKSFL